ncbi:MAG TPA: fibronectin type III domain-containing protein, partial [Saprospiraceae bacterium]|nr:fibronectin type III domain-containing protein [Saprospiraceae bacterium]
PSGLNATNITASSATLNWGAVSGASSYNVRARQVGTTTWSTGTATGTSVNFTGLTASTQYEFQVQAVCGSTTGSYSGSANFTTLSSGGGGGCTETFEPNNSRSGSLPLTAVNTNLSSQISTSTDQDWYRFANTSATRNIRVDLTTLPADYDVQLYQNNTLRGTSQNDGTTSEVITWNTTTVASNWYVRVYGYNGAFSNTQCYTLRISLSSSSFRTDGSTDGEVTEIEIPVEVINSGFSMFPNPALDQLTLDVNLEADRTVKVSVGDITGKTHILRSFDLFKGNSRATLDVSHLPAGTYFVRVENGEVIGTQKLVIMRP